VRATAISWVIAHHFWAYSRNQFQQVSHFASDAAAGSYSVVDHFIRLLEGSSLGIKLFWFVSGFCIHVGFLNWWRRRPVGSAAEIAPYLPRFFLARFWRIYPPYLLALLIAFVAAYSDQLGQLSSYAHLSVHVACIHNYFPAFIYDINYSFWSIAIESQRYLIYPFLLLLWVRLGARPAFFICIAISVGVQTIGPWFTEDYWMTKNPVFYWFDWLIGAYLAECWLEGRTFFRWHGPLFLLLVVCYASSFVLPVPNTVRTLLQPVVFALAFEWYIHRQSALGRFESLVAKLGTISYSVFLLHEPILRWASQPLAAAWPNLPVWVVFGLCFPLYLVPMLLASRLYYDWIEQPSNRLGKKRAAALNPAQPAAAVEA